MIYIAIFFFLFYFALTKDNRENNILYFWVAIALILFMGLSRELGSDRPAYIDEYTNIAVLLADFDSLWDNFLLLMALGRMPLWVLSEMLFSAVSPDDFTLFQFVHVCFVNGVIFGFFKKYSRCKFLCLFVYFCTSFLLFNCEIMRESTAVAITLLAVPYFLQRKWIKYYLICLLAFGFHASSIITFLFPLIPQFKLTKTKIFLLSVGIVVSYFVALPVFITVGDMLSVSFLGNRFNAYFSSGLNIIGLLYNLGLNFIFPSYLLYYVMRRRIFSDFVLLERFAPILVVLGAFITSLLTMNRLFNYLVVVQIVIYAMCLRNFILYMRYRLPYFILTFVVLFLSPIHDALYFFSSYDNGYHRFDFYYPYSTVFDDTDVYFRKGLRDYVLDMSSDKYQRE